MSITFHKDLMQGSDEWLSLRCGIITASEMKLLITPTLKIASNDKERAHIYELASQRITGHVEPHYMSDDMLRGLNDEADAKILYNEHYAPLETCGFITNNKWGFTIGYSPDALVGEKGLIEIKSRRQKYQIETITKDEVPSEYMVQIQTGLMVSERDWCDFISYCGGLPMYVKRVEADKEYQDAILAAAFSAEQKIKDTMRFYSEATTITRFIATERKVLQEMI